MKVVSPVAPQTEPSSRGIGYMTAAGLDYSGLTQGLHSLAAGAAAYQATQDKHQEFVTNTNFLNHIADTNEKIDYTKQNMPPDVGNSYEILKGQQTNYDAAFLKDVPAALQDQFKEKIAAKNAQLDAGYLQFQTDHNNKYYDATINKQATQGQVTIGNDPTQLPNTKAELVNSINASGLDTETKAAKLDLVNKMFETTAYAATAKKLEMFRVDPQAQIDYLSSRGVTDQASSDRIASLQPTFRQRLAVAINAAESATGERAAIRSATRTHDEQVAAYQRYQAGGGLAAAPAGMTRDDGSVAPGSRHERGMAADLNDGKVRDWLAATDEKTGMQNAERFGLSFLQGHSYEVDKGHIQMGGAVVDESNPTAGPQAGTYEAFKNAVKGVETAYGANNTISTKGAAGVMQVMPDTARDIAKEIKDPNFNPNWSDTEIQQYLQKNNDVAEQYGDHYLRQQLHNYGGDTELALIAYNAGPKRADEFIKSGRDPNVLPSETRDYIDKVYQKMGVPDTIDQNPQFKNVAYEDRLNARKDAEAQANKAYAETQQQQAVAYGNYLNTVQNGVLDGSVGVKDIDLARHEGRMKASDALTLTDRINAMAVEHDNAVTGNAKWNTEGALWSQSDNHDTTKADAMVKDVVKTLGQGDPKAAQQVQMFAQHTEIIPPSVIDTYRGMISGRDPAKAQLALSAMQQLSTIAPDAYRQAVPRDVADQVRTYNLLRSSIGDEKALETARTSWSPEAQQNKDRNEKDLNRILDEPLNPAHVDVKTEFGKFSSSLAPDNKVYGPQQQAMRGEWEAVLQYNYGKTNGDLKTALTMTHDMMSQTWGETNFGGTHTVMPHPIEKTMPPVNGNWDAYDMQLRHDYGIPKDAVIQLVTDDVTDRAVRAGTTLVARPDQSLGPQVETAKPSYKVAVFKDGYMQLLPDRWQPEFTSDMQVYNDNGKRLTLVNKQLTDAKNQLGTAFVTGSYTGMKPPAELGQKVDDLQKLHDELSNTVKSTEPDYHIPTTWEKLLWGNSATLDEHQQILRRAEENRHPRGK